MLESNFCKYKIEQTACLTKDVSEGRYMSFFSRGFGKNHMETREGDLIETLDGNIFDVKGLVHPPGKVIAFIRFTPDPHGERKRDNKRYKKVYPLNERYALLQERFPQYLVLDPVFNELLCEVPIEMVKKHYEPNKYLSRLRRKQVVENLEKQTVELAQLLQWRANIEWGALGVSGSLLVGLHTLKSDMDLLVYGSKSCNKVYDALKSLVGDEHSPVKSYDRPRLKTLFDFRSKDTTMKFEDFVRTESRKVLQGRFGQKDYFIRCVKEWDEISEKYGSVHYEPFGDAKVRATINDDSQMIFTPCTYQIEDVETLEGKTVEPLQEIVSFRGRFCEQARKGEQVIASGKVERVQKLNERLYFRLLLGNKPSDYMILAN